MKPTAGQRPCSLVGSGCRPRPRRTCGAVIFLIVALLLCGEAAWSEERREPARGTFLVASRDLLDPNFQRTVVLLLEYGEAGAVGLVVNRPSEVPLHRLIPYISGLRGSADMVFVGGPVEPLRMTFLFRADRQRADALRVLDEVWASSRFDLLESTVEEGKFPYRVYAGYAGWAARQLDAEVERGDWLVLEGTPGAVFSEAPEELWPQLVQRTELRVVKGPPPPE
jgi:putative transcriptional regulator